MAGRERVLKYSCVGVFILLALLSLTTTAAAPGDESVAIRIGWQIPAATQGQILQVLKRTDVLDTHDLDASLVPFSYGGPQVEAASAGKLDVFFAGDQPAINLIARGGKWKIVARLFSDGVATIVPPDSPIRRIEDLKGKTVASAFGSVGQREAFLQQQAAGLVAGIDVNNQNLDILEIRRRVLDGGIATWKGMDAAVAWEPIVSGFELEGIARVLAAKHYLGVVAMSEDFIDNHPDAAVQFLMALLRAWDFFARDPDRVMRWYIDDTRLDYTPEALTAARSDSNFMAQSVHGIDMTLNEEHIAILEQGAAWGRDTGEGHTDIRLSVDQRLLDKARQAIATSRFEDLQVILPSNSESPLINAAQGYALDEIPLGLLFAIMILLALLTIESGFWLGKRGKHILENETGNPIATVVGAVLGMMAFVIALTFGSANNRFDERKTALLEDVTAIQTAYLRASLLPEPHRTTVRNLLRDYVQVRVGMVHAYGLPDTLRLVQRRAETLQDLLWSHVEELAEVHSESRVYVLFVSAINEVFSLHTKRVVLGAHYRMPVFVWIALVFASGVAMVAVGYQFGISGRRRVVTANLALAMTFAVVMLLAFDLDRTGEGLVAVNQQPMFDLYQSMNIRR